MQARLAALEVALQTERELRLAAESERDRALAAYRAVQTELELLRRRIFAAKAERVDTTQLELEFAQKLAKLDALEDGGLPLDNNRSERELRRVAFGRKNWLFVGCDDHAQAAGALLSLIASARLHDLDPEAYLRDLFRVLPHWPRDRYLELAPKYWSRTRGTLDIRELAAEIGHLTVPPAVEQVSSR